MAVEAPDRAKRLLLDDRVVARAENARLTMGQVSKEARNPLFVEDRPWEVRFDNLYANVIYDEDAHLYTCWYNPFIIDAATSNTPLTARSTVSYQPDKAREMGVCLATSPDGLTWVKPELGLHEFAGSRENNLVMRHIHGAGIFRDTHEPDPAMRYKALMQYGVAASPDGLHWSAVKHCPEIESRWDTHNNLFWDEPSQRYVGITRLWEGGMRTVGRTESQDFQRWTRAVEVMRGLPAEAHRQTYALIAFPYANLYLGMVMIFDVVSDFVDCELAWSPDTLSWQRICPGTPLIPRGEPGSFDSGCIYAAAYPVRRGDGLELFYGGSNGPHTNWRETGLGLARLRGDGFAGMQPATRGKSACLVTAPMRCTGRDLAISADAAGGSVHVSVLDAQQQQVRQSHSIHTNITDQTVAWEGNDLAALVGEEVQLLFEFEDATLYAFRM
jgi:hypothetical protein